MFMSKIIGLDVDDVVCNLVDYWLQVYNLEYDDWVSETDIKSWTINKYVKCGDKIYDYLKYPSLYDGVRPVEDAGLGIRCLRELGFRIVFITASTPEQAGRKYKWLCDYGMIEHRREYIEALDKSLIKTDYLIDDNPENVIGASGRGIIFTREWNKFLEDYSRVDNWIDIIKYFTDIKNMEYSEVL
jgi:5'-nucleotidase